ncbi:unnamed protein product, partial [Callosobruchus maculatus]
MDKKRKRRTAVEVCVETPRKKSKLCAKFLFDDETDTVDVEVDNVDSDCDEEISEPSLESTTTKEDDLNRTSPTAGK